MPPLWSAKRGSHVSRTGITGVGARVVPGDTALPHVTVQRHWLQALAVQLKLHRTEWRVVAIVLSSPSPESSSTIAKQLRLDYSLVKRVVRELEAWTILERTSDGLRF